ncbi:MAG: 50S ribosomal protein L23 [Rhodobacteraceae bacterium]|jgi:large subunit ribosomal protein L23|nr:50S ribosomal protein L23 [Paracoccaceae bacterium]MAS99998.1 50S ribosomal protein L23 [Paracoccaceae bacterium]MBL6856051.1 50S ribosomal protein L23 [Paracoccaceae bacterium]MDG1299869.1 50S ribosomal protein L23 [Paracoccaceae bacterium]MDG1878918.1 50S ribosomal protein L23 [Paracoccaceae bacterium]|tara:strand:+ start:1697 stop:1993 length:297 start_codon:yes stop_codon:yes gene_type:complete
MSSKPEYYDIIRRPIVTEKATMASESGAVVFEVAMDSSKPIIKEAVEALFNVKVKAVNTTISKGKIKRFKGQLGKRKNTKKAYVMLEDGNTIDVSTGL